MAQPPLKQRIDAVSSTNSPEVFYSSDSRSSLDEPESPDCKFCVVFMCLWYWVMIVQVQRYLEHAYQIVTLKAPQVLMPCVYIMGV